jgi:hypothetical protein
MVQKLRRYPCIAVCREAVPPLTCKLKLSLEIRFVSERHLIFVNVYILYGF